MLRLKTSIMSLLLSIALSWLPFNMHVLAAADTQMVYKYDGSVQCQAAADNMAAMGKGLIDHGIKIIRSCKGNDGLIRPALCGAPTGNINIYEIPATSLQQAIELGFVVLDGQHIYKKSCKATSPD